MVCALLTLLLCAAAVPAAAAAELRKDFNVIFITVDDLKPTLGAYGDSVAQTPNLDALLQRGLRFDNKHCQKSECAPSRSSALSGKRPDALRVWGFDPVFRSRNPTLMTWPGHIRRERNYRTEAVGKVFDNRNFFMSEDAVTVDGPDVCKKASSDTKEFCSFDYYATIQDLYSKPEYCGELALRWPQAVADPVMEDNKHLALVYEFDDAYSKRHIDYCVRKVAVERLRVLANGSQPFFLSVGFAKPHMPWVAPRHDFDAFRQVPDSLLTVPPEIASGLGPLDFWSDKSYSHPGSNDELDKYGGSASVDAGDRVRGYYASTRFVDTQIGELVRVLEEEVSETVRNDTMLIFWGDHGFHLGQYDVWGKKTVFEHATRVPAGLVPPRSWLASLEGGTAAGVGAGTLAPTEATDFFPTVLDFIGLDLPMNSKGNVQKIAGTSLLPLLRDPSTYVRSAAISEYENQLSRPANLMGYSVRTRCHRLILYLTLKSQTGVLSTKSPKELSLFRYSEPGTWETEDIIDDASAAVARAALLAIVNHKDLDKDWTHVLGEKPFDHDSCDV